MASKRKSTSTGSTSAKAPSAGRWLARLGMYDTKRALTFENADELKKAIAALWDPADELYRMPRAPAGALTMVVPADAVLLFRAHRFRFAEHPVIPAVRGNGNRRDSDFA